MDDGMKDQADQVHERVLILRCQNGDHGAFAELVQRYHLRMRYYLRKMLGDVHRADDALQELWFDVFRALPRLRDTEAFTAWLYRIARDRAYRQLRRHRVMEPLEPTTLAAAEVDDAFSPEDAAAIHAALDHLTPEQRETLILRFIEAMSYERIAAVTGVPVGTVRSRLHHAKRALRRLLERTDDHEGKRIGPSPAGL